MRPIRAVVIVAVLAMAFIFFSSVTLFVFGVALLAWAIVSKRDLRRPVRVAVGLLGAAICILSVVPALDLAFGNVGQWM